MNKSTVVPACLIILVIAAAVVAQQAPFKRTILQQVDISIPGHEVVTAVAEFQPGGSADPHTHFGEEVGYVIEGTIVVQQKGKAAETVGPGKAFVIPAGIVHSARNSGSGIARIVASYIVEKGKPLATPAPGQ